VLGRPRARCILDVSLETSFTPYLETKRTGEVSQVGELFVGKRSKISLFEKVAERRIGITPYYYLLFRPFLGEINIR
jgi:hypothetical protein